MSLALNLFWYSKQQHSYACAGCSSSCGLLTAQIGNLSDGSGPSGYSNNANCKWMIAPAAASIITLSFTELSTQPGVDIIRVFQCTDIACSQPQQLAELSGSYSTPQAVTSTTGYVMLIFMSDESINFDGFNVSWESVSQYEFSFVSHMRSHIEVYDSWHEQHFSVHLQDGIKLHGTKGNGESCSSTSSRVFLA